MARILELLAQNLSGESNTPTVDQLLIPLPPPNSQPEHNPPPPPLHPPLTLQPPRHIKMNFPRFSGGDLTQRLRKTKEYSAYKGVTRAQQVSFASYLTEEVNEWWLATSKALDINPNKSPWETFEEGLWNHFGPTESENFHEALSKIQQTCTLREYQRDFGRLMRLTISMKKTLVGSYVVWIHAST